MLWAFSAEIVFLICCSETPAGVSEQLFHGKGSSRQTAAANNFSGLALSVKALRLCQLSQRESLWRNHKLCGLTGNFSAMPRPLPLGEVDLRSKDGEGEDASRWTLSVIAARCQLPRKGELFVICRSVQIKLPLRGKTSPAPGEDVAQRQKGESGERM